MKQKALVLAATSYQSVNEQTGNVTNGLSIEYVGDVIEEKGETYTKRGYYPFKEAITDFNLISAIDVIPGIYEFDLVMKSNSKDRKPRLVITGIKKIDSFKMPV